jgi:hypothetical protein
MLQFDTLGRAIFEDVFEDVSEGATLKIVQG